MVFFGLVVIVPHLKVFCLPVGETALGKCGACNHELLPTQGRSEKKRTKTQG
jgi:hypothetical protein